MRSMNNSKCKGPVVEGYGKNELKEILVAGWRIAISLVKEERPPKAVESL